MIPRKFNYVAARSLREAVSILRRHREDAKVLAGGHSLIPLMKLRLASPRYVVDLGPLKKQLSYIKDAGRTIRIGALTTHAEIEHSALLKRELPLMPAAAEWIGDMQVRNLGTIGGSLSHSDPASDWPVVALALDAQFAVYGGAKRVIPASKFFKGPFTTALKPYEILTEVIIPKPPKGHGWSWKKFERKAGDFATVNTAVIVTPGKKGEIQKASIAVGAVHNHPYRATEAEKLLQAKRPSAELIERAAAAAAAYAEPSSDLRGSAEYKKEMTKVFVRRALREALERAGLMEKVEARVV